MTSQPTTCHLQSRSGQGLLEAILAIAVFAAIAGVLITMAVGGFRGLEQGGEQTEAEALAQLGIEAVRAVRDKAWNENIVDSVNNTAKVRITANVWELYDYRTSVDPLAPEGGLGTNNKFSRTITFTDVCRDNTTNAITTPCGGSTYNDPHTKQAVSSVSWTTRGNAQNTVEKRAYITNWDSKDNFEDTAANFSDGTFSSTVGSALGDGQSVTLTPQ